MSDRSFKVLLNILNSVWCDLLDGSAVVGKSACDREGMRCKEPSSDAQKM